MPVNSLPFITLKNISVRMGDRLILPNTSWEIKTGQQWAVLGQNGAGKSSLVRAVAGDLPIVRGNVIRHYNGQPYESIAYVSFELHRSLIAQEENKDHARFFSGDIDNLTTVRHILEPSALNSVNLETIADQMEISHILNRPISYLSTGEMRKTLIARAIMKSPRLLILDEPFDGLDMNSSNRLIEIIRRLMNGNMQIVLVTHRSKEIPPEISHVLYVKDCQVIMQGEKNRVISTALEKNSFSPEKFQAVVPVKNVDRHVPQILVQMKNTTVRYGKILVLDRLNWTIRQGENWAVLGPNGAGKTTLLSLISGDNPQAYSNEIYLFGRRRGSGESIWDIKHYIGAVSAELQIRYRKNLTAFETVVSGFFDSIGLYRYSTREQRETALQWIRHLGIEDKSDRLFNRLSYGEQRMVLLARSMVKSPVILILDEPCQGLDQANRDRILSLIDFIGHNTKTNILYVTHHPEEIPSCISNRLHL